ncbi:hypothetical protein CTI12_AA078760 [Artemisia annua]|uniref:Uncharacterized protein n=1 Tax=Artemisia annua TaxID=35608 RepID=A0A2U1Q3V8_ARTAN|nr:hypothetical protein CTI12_AA078760 [Artemisia annua]
MLELAYESALYDYIQGYVRNKLKKQYIHLKEEIWCRDTNIIILSPEVAFTGDITSDFLLDPRSSDALRAKVLITESFVPDPNGWYFILVPLKSYNFFSSCRIKLSRLNSKGLSPQRGSHRIAQTFTKMVEPFGMVYPPTTLGP